jgi:hypothetical protein
MEWIKKNPHQLALALLSAALIGVSVMVLLKAQSLPESFADVQNTPPQNNTIPPLELEPVEQALAEISKPSQWTAENKATAAVFVPERFIIENGQPTKLTTSTLTDSETGKAIPAQWFLDFRLNPVDPKVTMQDPDGDGFFNQDEWRNNTDPTKKESHPPFHTKLYLKNFIRVPFLLKFQAYDVDPKKPENNSFQLNTLSVRQPTLFLKAGEKVPRTNYRIEKFEAKAVMNPSTGIETDVSELTLMNLETNEPVVLVLNRVTDSPESFADFSYQWPSPAQDIRVKKLQEFVLRPNIQERYKLLDIQETEALIQLPSGEKYTVPKPPAGLTQLR